MKLPRIMIAAGASGSGKTLLTCGLLKALKNRGVPVTSFKCGPDYIDPMFHSRVIGVGSCNLDTFFTSGEVTRYLLQRNAKDSGLALMEGVMGYYDGLGGVSEKASAYDLAKTTDTPVILLVNAKGMSASVSAYVKGFLHHREDSRIRGVIFNRMNPMLYPRIKALVEEETGVTVLGYVPEVSDCRIESRHLGLVLPDEIADLQERLGRLAEILETSLDLDGILALANSAPEMERALPDQAFSAVRTPDKKPLRIGVARDEAFCFFYKDNIRILEEMGAELVFFSPIHDKALPEDLDGMLLYGGYPELYAEQLEKNTTMRHSVRGAITGGMPCMAECGGFLYLHRELCDMEGEPHRMVDVIPARAFYTGKLSRFGYLTLRANAEGAEDMKACGDIPVHEFHYFDSEACGDAFHGEKPLGGRSWDCIHDDGRLLAGFPHFYYYGNPRVPEAFLRRCLAYREETS